MKALLTTEISLLGYHYQLEIRVANSFGGKSKELYFVATYKGGELFELSDGLENKAIINRMFDRKRCGLEVI